MSGGELAVVLASVAVVVAVAVLGAIGVTLNRALRDLRRLLSEIRRDLVPAVQRIEEASGQVTGEVERVGGLLDVAERVSERAESLSQVTYRALVEPLNAVASLFRRGASARPAESLHVEPAATGPGGNATAPRSPRRTPWARRLTLYLLRSGYRSASTRIAGRMAAAAAQGGVKEAGRSGRRTDGSTGGTTPGSAGSGTGRTSGPQEGLTLGGQLLESIREVTREISEAMEEGRQVLRDGWEREEPPK